MHLEHPVIVFAFIGGKEIRVVRIPLVGVNAASERPEILLASKCYAVAVRPGFHSHDVTEMNFDPFEAWKAVGGMKLRVEMVGVYLCHQAPELVVVPVGMAQPGAVPASGNAIGGRGLLRRLPPFIIKRGTAGGENGHQSGREQDGNRVPKRHPALIGGEQTELTGLTEFWRGQVDEDMD